MVSFVGVCILLKFVRVRSQTVKKSYLEVSASGNVPIYEVRGTSLQIAQGITVLLEVY